MHTRNPRRDEILRHIARRCADQQRAPERAQLSAALDAVNAVGYLEEVQEKPPESLLCCGPKVVYGEGWAGVVVWHRPRGYYAYSTLTLLGIWAFLDADGAVALALGTRELTFSAPYYSAESYHRQIQTRYDLLYKDEGGLPAEDDRLYTVRYEPARRLDIRRALESELRRWAQTQRGNT